MPAHKSSAADMPPPPEPGTPIVRVVEFYTEVARGLVPGWDLELVPLEGKNPGIGGVAWQDHASSDPAAVLEHLRALGPAGRRVDGLGALMNRHIAFDIDHPEHLPPDLGALLAGGLPSSTRPGRMHRIFRSPAGRRVGGRKDLINAAYPSPGGSWGELKAHHGQVRIWSPNGDGTHVALVPGVVPELPVELGPLLLEPEFYYGDSMSDAMLDDWLDGHTLEIRPDWLAVDLARLPEISPGGDATKNGRLVSRVWNVGVNLSADAYGGRRAYEALHDAWIDLCVAEGDYVTTGPGSHEAKYRGLWRRVAGKLTTDPKALADVEAKRLVVWGSGGGSWDPENDEEDRKLAELIGIVARNSGVEIGVTADLPSVEVAALLAAVDDDEMGLPVVVLPPVVDLATRMEARLARLETKPPELPVVEDEENSRSSFEPSSTGPPGPTGAVGPSGPVGAAGPTGPPDEPLPLVGSSVEFDGLTPYERRVRSKVGDILRPGMLTGADGKPVPNLARTEFEKLLAKDTALLAKREMSRFPVVRVVIDVASLVAETPPPIMLVSPDLGLIYEDAINSIFGSKACGKSWLMMAEVLRQIRAGRVCCWLDWEMTQNRVGQRLVQLGATPDELAALWYFPMSRATVGDVMEELGALPRGSMVVLDSVSRAMTNEGVDVGDENSNTHYIAWFEKLAALRSRAALAVSAIDHVGHTNKERGRGASAKGQQADAELSMDVVEQWSRGRAGWAALTCRKDRGGFLDEDSPKWGAFFQPAVGRVDWKGVPVDGALDVTVRELTVGEMGMAAKASMTDAEKAKTEREDKVAAKKGEEFGAVMVVLADGEVHSKAAIGRATKWTEAIVKRVVLAMMAEDLIADSGVTSGTGAGVFLTTEGMIAARARGIVGVP